MRTPLSLSLTYGLVESLGLGIVTDEFKGAPFPTEAELCKRYGASRTVTREAVKMLTAKGLVSARPRHGTTIEPESHWNLLDPDVLRWLLERNFSEERLRQFTEMRLAIEPTSAQLAAKNWTPESLAKIEAALDRMRHASDGSDDTLSADIAFHAAILAATNNPFFAQLQEFINTALRFSIRFTNRIKGRTADIGAHEAVFLAIQARDAETAGEAVRAIIAEVMALIDAAQRKPV